MIKQRSQADGFLLLVSQDLDVRTVTIPVQDQIVYHEHLPDIAFPTHAEAEVQRRFAIVMLGLVIDIQCDLVLAPFLEVLGGTKPGFLFFPGNDDIGVDELIMQMLDAEEREQAIDDEFIDALMANDPFDIVVVRELVVDLLAAQLGVRFEKRSRCTGGMADLAPGKISEILLHSDDLCFHVTSPRVQV